LWYYYQSHGADYIGRPKEVTAEAAAAAASSSTTAKLRQPAKKHAQKLTQIDAVEGGVKEGAITSDSVLTEF
jgi:hypothetical protein